MPDNPDLLKEVVFMRKFHFLIFFFMFLCFYLCFCCFPAFSENIDISGLSFSELVVLKDRINLALWNSDEWQEVEVPAGVWIIGEDIPSGHWTISAVPDSFANITYCDALAPDGQSPANGWQGWNGVLTGYKNSDGSWYEHGRNSVDLNLENGHFLIVYTDVVITPYSGKPSLNFK